MKRDGRCRPKPDSSARLKRWWRVVEPTLPRCGAKARTTGDPCRRPAMANGRCRFHGGATPSGKRWHVITCTTPEHPDVAARIARKIADKARAARKRAARLAAMSPEERERDRRWHAARKPGPKSGRTTNRAMRQASAAVREVLERPPTPPNAEARELDALIRKARALLPDDQK